MTRRARMAYKDTDREMEGRLGHPTIRGIRKTWAVMENKAQPSM
jgi:hypothetical protein